MKKLLLLLLIPFAGLAQEKGVHFEKGLSFQQVKQKAKKENKYLFVDCSTTWCYWCKRLAADVFPQPKVGAFFNKNFVSVEVQMDETAKDNDDVKSWRPDAKTLSAYVKGYPTCLVFSPEGVLVHRIVGYADADAYIALVQKSLHPETQYFTLLHRYETGEKDTALLYHLTTAAIEQDDSETAGKVSQDYLATQSDLYTKKNLEFIAQTTTDSKSKGFDLLLNHAAEADAVLGKGAAEGQISGIIINEEVYSKMKRDGKNNVDSLVAAAKAKYPAADLAKRIAMVYIQEYQLEKNWTKYQPAVLAYMEKYGSEVSPDMLNNFAWTVFANCQDPDCVAKAMEWSKSSVDATTGKNPAFLDTYANLLYKSGKSKEAIAMEEKALALVSESEKPTYSATLEKMKKNEKISTATTE